MKAYNEIGFHIDRAQEPTAPFSLQKAKDNTGTVDHALIDEQLKQVGFDKAVKALLQFMEGEIPQYRFMSIVQTAKARYFDPL